LQDFFLIIPSLQVLIQRKSMQARLLLNQFVYRLRGGFLIRSALIAISIGVIGAALSRLEVAFPGIHSWIPRFFLVSGLDNQVAQVILSTIASSTMTIVSIVFAMLLMALTLASMQFSPRIMVGFTSDGITQQTLGLFLGTFLYCLAALPSAHTQESPVVPILAIMGAMFLALACVIWLIFFIYHISQSISVNQIVHKIARETESMIDHMMPRTRVSGRMGEHDGLVPNDKETPILSITSGYVRFVESNRLLSLSKEHHVVIRVIRRVGNFVPEGIPLMMVSAKDKLISDELREDLRGTFDIGPTRTLQQDIEFGILQIVDIALKAISPAVNDPSTAITCIDQLSSILIRYASRQPQETLLSSPPGNVRVSIPPMKFSRLSETAFEQIRLYSKSDVAVSMRMQRALHDISITVPDWDDRRFLAGIGKRIVNGCSEHLNREEISEILVRQSALEELAGEYYSGVNSTAAR
jgi:uncharacterized membrane protein